MSRATASDKSPLSLSLGVTFTRAEKKEKEEKGRERGKEGNHLPAIRQENNA